MSDEAKFGITHTGAIDDDWHEQYGSGDYIEGGAGAMAERILKAPQGRDAPDPNRPARRRRGSDLPQGFGDAAARDGYDARTGS